MSAVSTVSGASLWPATDADTERRGGAPTPLAVALFVVFAAYAAVFGLFAHGVEAVWGAWAVGAYGAAATVAAWCWRRHPGVPLVVALGGALALPAVFLPANWGATSEVRVVARSAALWLARGTPYLASGQLASWRSYDPYLPGMSLFGVPHAVHLPGALGDPLLWLAIATAGALAAACRIAGPCVARRCEHCRRQALLCTMLLLSCPVFALPMSLGVTDPPVIALVCLGLALTVPSSDRCAELAVDRFHAAATVRAGEDAASCRGCRPLLAGVAIGAACALKAIAWPAFPVVLALLVVRDGRRAAARFTLSSLGTFLGLVVITAPALLGKPRAIWQNLVEYPLGLSHSLTQAASPLPGHLLAGTGSLGHFAAIVLLVGATLVLGASLVLRPPRDVRQASVRLALGLTVFFLLAPDARFGYFAYPLGILFWLVLTRPWPGSPPRLASAERSSAAVMARTRISLGRMRISLREEREVGVAPVQADDAPRGVRRRAAEVDVREVRTR